jgi:hypothetical protein
VFSCRVFTIGTDGAVARLAESISGVGRKRSREIDLEIDMTLLARSILYPPVSMHDRRNSSDISFAVWISIILVGLAIVSVALGVAPVVDPVSPPF